VWASGNETTSGAQCRLWKSLAPNQIRKRFVRQETLPRRTPKIHTEAEEALGKLKRCPSLADLTAFLGITVGPLCSPPTVGATHRRYYLHAVIVVESAKG
jgi:hypothetical protein